MKLHTRVLGEGQPLVILHGLFGYSDNWQTLALRLADYFKVVLVDQRNHGHSNWADSHTYQDMATDLYEVCEDLELSKIVLMGHSMGGKTAMFFADAHEELLDKLIVVDMGSKSYPPHHQLILEGLNALKINQYKSRTEADEVLKTYIPSIAVRQFLLKNLYWKEKGKLAWRINIPILEKFMPEILEAFDPQRPIDVPTLFIKAELSNYILRDDWDAISNVFVDSKLVEIKGSDHWVHAEKPEEFLNTVLSFCLQ